MGAGKWSGKGSPHGSERQCCPDTYIPQQQPRRGFSQNQQAREISLGNMPLELQLKILKYRFVQLEPGEMLSLLCSKNKLIHSLSEDATIWQAIELKLPNDLSLHNTLLLRRQTGIGLPVLGQSLTHIGEEVVESRRAFITRLKDEALNQVSELQKARLSVLAVINTEKNILEIGDPAIYQKEEYAKGLLVFQLDFLQKAMDVWKKIDTGHPPESIEGRLDCPWKQPHTYWKIEEKAYKHHHILLVSMVRGLLFLTCEVIASEVNQKLANNPSLNLWQELADRWQCLSQFLELLPDIWLARIRLEDAWDNLEPIPSICHLAHLAFRAKVLLDVKLRKKLVEGLGNQDQREFLRLFAEAKDYPKAKPQHRSQLRYRSFYKLYDVVPWGWGRHS